MWCLIIVLYTRILRERERERERQTETETESIKVLIINCENKDEPMNLFFLYLLLPAKYT